MTHRQKIDSLIPELKAKGVGWNWSSPPLFRTIWALGIEIPPPQFMDFLPLAVLIGGLFFSVFAIFRLLVLGLRADLWGDFLVLSAISGVLGLIASWSFRRKAKALQLPTWDNYGNSN